MKTFFYKKLIPLAMITSLTATSMATVVEATQPTETTDATAVETADVPTVPTDLEAAIANDAVAVMETGNGEDAGDTEEATTPSQEATSEPTTTVAPAADLADYEVADGAKIEANFDYVDTDANVKTFDITLNVNNKKKATNAKLSNVSFVTEDEKALPEGFDALKIIAVKGDNKANTVTVTVEAKYGAAATGSYKVKVGNSVSKNTVAFERTVGIVDSEYNGGNYSYHGSNEELNIINAFGVGNGVNNIVPLTGDSEGKGNDNVKKITLNGAVTIIADAFKGWDNLSLIDAQNNNVTVNDGAFAGTSQGIAIVTSGRVTFSGTKPSNVFVFDDSSEAITDALSIKAGDELSASFAAKTVGYAGGVAELKKIDTTGMDEKAAAKIATDPEIAAADTSKIKWNIKGSAKFAKVDKNGVPVQNATTEAYTYNAASLTGVKNVKIGNTKANGQLNSIVTVTVQVPVTSGNKTVYKDAYTATLYVKPSKVTKLTATAKTGAVTFAKATVSEPTTQEAVTPENWTLTMDEGATFALPIKATDGANKTLQYEVTGDNVTVVNGKVKAVTPGTDTKIMVTPVDAEEDVTPIEVAVTVKAKTTAINANTKSITVVPGAPMQEVTLSATSNKEMALKVTASNKFAVKYKDTTGNWVAITDSTKVNGAVTLGIEVDGTNYKTTDKLTAADKKITVDLGGKATVITANVAGAPQNLKTLKEKNKLKKGEGTIKINIPVGGVASLGISANPATADNGFGWYITDENGDEVSTAITMVGDTVKATATGVYYAYATSNGLNENGDPVETNLYEINVYDPGSSIVWDEEIDSTDDIPDYVIKGGYLMSKDNAETKSDKTVDAGKNVVIAVPDLTGIAPGNKPENVIWTVNNPANVNLDVQDDADKMIINAAVAGTYTITGTTEFTKQKYSFKIMAVENFTTDSAKTDNFGVVANAEIDSDGQIIANKGDKIQLSAFGDNKACAGKVTFTSSEKTVANINAKGQLTALKEGTAEITVKLEAKNTKAGNNGSAVEKKVKIKVNPPSDDVAKPAAKAPTFAATNGSFKVSVSMAEAPAGWKYVNYEDFDWDNTSTAKDLFVAEKDGKVYKPSQSSKAAGKSATACIADEGKYMVYGVNAKGEIVTAPATIEIFETVAKTVSVVEPFDVSLKDWAGKIGILSGAVGEPEKEVTLAIKATGTNADGKTLMASDGDIDWASSNVNLATAYTKKETGMPGYTPYSYVTIKLNNKGYTGKVTLTGTLKNSGKKVKITLNITGHEDAPSTND